MLRCKKEVRVRHFLMINSLSLGGAERQVFLLGEHLQFDKIFLLYPPSIPIPPSLSIKVFYPSWLPVNPLGKLLATIYAFFYSCFYFSKKDRVISFLETSNFLNVLVSFFTHHKTVVSMRSNPHSQHQGWKGKIFKSGISYFYPKANLVVTNTFGSKYSLINSFHLPEKKVEMIPNGLDLMGKKYEETPLPVEEESLFDYPVLIHVARFDPAKGHHYLLHVFKHVLHRMPKCKLILIGDGDLKNEIVDLALQLNFIIHLEGITKLNPHIQQIFFLGYRKNPMPYLKRSQLFLFTSLWEGMPNSVMEALAYGPPVISSDCDFGPREILYEGEKKYGILHPPFEVEGRPSIQLEMIYQQWADSIQLLLENKELYRFYSTLSRERAYQFDIKRVAELWSKQLNDLH